MNQVSKSQSPFPDVFGLRRSFVNVCLTLTIGMVTSTLSPAASTAGTGTVLRVGLELTDGSFLIGRPSVSNIAIRTSYADLRVDLDHISGLTISTNDRMASVELRNGDRIKGSLETTEMRVESLIGDVLIRREQVVAIRVLRGAVLDAQFMNGLVLHYTFDSPDKLAADNGPAGRHGTVHGAKYAENGRRNGAADFDGRTSHIRTPVVDTTKDLTWALWVMPRTLVGTDRVVQPIGLKGHAWVWNSCNTSIHFFREDNNDGWVRFYIQGPQNSVGARVKVDDVVGRWTHLACTVGQDGWRIYRDGKLVGKIAESTRIGSPCEMIVGANDNGPQRYFDGLIDEVMVFERALSEDEIRQLYESQK